VLSFLYEKQRKVEDFDQHRAKEKPKGEAGSAKAELASASRQVRASA